ncbi:hypothetical protein [Streptomyces sp. NPDC047000]|uniref:hypothetical protein n=1 Tax=Streptomyces sp. NPDC047000 TaxID=3155474 RepID=UPI0033D8D1D5
MGLFSRRAKKEDPRARAVNPPDEQDARARAVNMLEETAAEFWPKVPATFPDGTPFPARPAYDEIVALGRALAFSPHPDAADLMMYCFKTLAGFAEVANPETFLASNAVEAADARGLLLEAGMVQEERALSRGLLLILDYHEKAGHELVMDIDAEGNRV